MALPRELWQAILRYAISCPVFFEQDPIESFGIEATITQYYDDGPYYDSERTRNTLQRVCSSWNDYLGYFKYRFLEFSDVFHNRIPYTAMSQARRITIKTCSCMQCAATVINRDLLAEKVFSAALKSQDKPWAVEILDGEWEQTQWKWLSALQTQAPQLKSILRQESSYLDTIIGLFPNTIILTSSTPGIFTSPCPPPIISSHLTTMSLQLADFRDVHLWDLPNLLHFTFFALDITANDYIAIASALGKNLITFFDSSLAQGEDLPDDIWKLCPRVQHFQTSLGWPAICRIGKCVRCIRVRPALIDEATHLEDAIPLIALKRASVTTLVLDTTWWDVARCGYVYAYVSIGVDNGLVIKDVVGLTFLQFVIMLIRINGKGDRRNDAYARGVVEKFFWV